MPLCLLASFCSSNPDPAIFRRSPARFFLLNAPRSAAVHISLLLRAGCVLGHVLKNKFDNSHGVVMQLRMPSGTRKEMHVHVDIWYSRNSCCHVVGRVKNQQKSGHVVAMLLQVSRITKKQNVQVLMQEFGMTENVFVC